MWWVVLGACVADGKLGIGSIGTLIAHHLRVANPDAAVSLVFRNAAAYSKKKLRRDGAERPTLRVAQNGGDTVVSDEFDVDVASASRVEGLATAADEDNLDFVNVGGPIDSLIVCTKAQATSTALAGLQSRLSPSSVIALLQNGMGVYDELCSTYWPEPATRPQFILGTTTHGVTPAGQPGSVLHMSRPGQGAVKWGVVPDPRKEVDFEKWLWGKHVGDLPALTPPPSPTLPLPPAPQGTGTENVRATLEALLRMSPLSPSLLPMPHLYHELLLKLAVNAAVNPLTAVLGGGYLANGALNRSGPGNRLVQQVVRETGAILTAYLHNLAGAHPAPADTVRLFSYDSLLQRVNDVISATRDNISSMAGDVKAGRMTEIDYINGYLVSLGHRLGVPVSTNRMLVQMVKFKAEVGGLGHKLYPAVEGAVRRGEESALDGRRLALEERKVALEERAMLLREGRHAEAKRTRREFKRAVRRNAAIAREMRKAEIETAIKAGADPAAFVGETSEGNDDGQGGATASGNSSGDSSGNLSGNTSGDAATGPAAGAVSSRSSRDGGA